MEHFSVLVMTAFQYFPLMYGFFIEISMEDIVSRQENSKDYHHFSVLKHWNLVVIASWPAYFTCNDLKTARKNSFPIILRQAIVILPLLFHRDIVTIDIL